MFKKTLVCFFMFCLIISLPIASLAESEILSDIELRKIEKILLTEVGLNEETINFIPKELQRKLVNEGAKLLGTNGIVTYQFPESYNSEFNISSDPLPTLDFLGQAYSVNSDRPGYKKFLMLGVFHWTSNPAWTLTDGMTIGYPESTRFFLPTSGGQVQQFEAKHCGVRVNGNGTHCTSTNTPEISSAAGGVGTKVALSSARRGENGYIQQYVYVEDSESGTTNVLFQYGHAYYTGKISFSVGSSGFGVSISPTSSVDIKSYIVELRY